MVEGTITEFKDRGTELGFEVTLGLRDIGNGTLTATDETASATFGNSNDANGTGTWSAQTYGINADEGCDADDAAERQRTFPSGIAGEFDVNSTYTKVVGAFAAKRK